jgi:hypothetical protein
MVRSGSRGGGSSQKERAAAGMANNVGCRRLLGKDQTNQRKESAMRNDSRTKAIDVTFIGGPHDGLEMTFARVHMNWEETGPSGQRHLWIIDEHEGRFYFVYQGARAKECAGR